jgi:hypothetical protein
LVGHPLAYPEDSAARFFVSIHFTHRAAALTFQINSPVARAGIEEGAVRRTGASNRTEKQ